MFSLPNTFENPDDFKKEPSELHSDADQDEDTMFSDHALQMKLSSTKGLDIQYGENISWHHTSLVAVHATSVFNSNNGNDDESSSDDSDKNNDPQSKAGAGQTDKEDNNSIEEQMLAT
ncbi:hypothetical protein EDB19DRAFT_1908664 [Suillus lakei]|nr:hypothetical protein EDB19DRAFT_1908664 [Suillus lakei]